MNRIWQYWHYYELCFPIFAVSFHMILVNMKLDVSEYMRITFMGWISNDTSKTKLAILAFLCCGELMKNFIGMFVMLGITIYICYIRKTFFVVKNNHPYFMRNTIVLFSHLPPFVRLLCSSPGLLCSTRPFERDVTFEFFLFEYFH